MPTTSRPAAALLMPLCCGYCCVLLDTYVRNTLYRWQMMFGAMEQCGIFINRLQLHIVLMMMRQLGVGQQWKRCV